MVLKKLPPAQYLRECLLYDPATGSLQWKARPRRHFKTHGGWRNFNTNYAGTRAGALWVNKNGGSMHITVCINGVIYQAHRVIWKMTKGRIGAAMLIDHRDGDKTNNRLSNLRQATRRQNNINSALPKNNTSGYKGAYFVPGRMSRPWMAKISARWVKKKFLGYFSTPEEAHTAYCMAAEKHYGEFARFK